MHCFDDLITIDTLDMPKDLTKAIDLVRSMVIEKKPRLENDLNHANRDKDKRLCYHVTSDHSDEHIEDTGCDTLTNGDKERYIKKSSENIYLSL